MRVQKIRLLARKKQWRSCRKIEVIDIIEIVTKLFNYREKLRSSRKIGE